MKNQQNPKKKSPRKTATSNDGNHMIGPNPESVPNVDALTKRLGEYQGKRFKLNEAFNIINEFLLTPYLPSMIESLNKVHRVRVCTDENNYIFALKLQCERDKKPGVWNWLKRFFCPYENCLKVWHNGTLFVCEYFRHSFFEMVDKVKTDYDIKIKPTVNQEFVVVCKAR